MSLKFEVDKMVGHIMSEIEEKDAHNQYRFLQVLSGELKSMADHIIEETPDEEKGLRSDEDA